MRLRTLLVVALVSCAFGRPAEAQIPAPILTTLDSFGLVGEWSDVALRADGRGVIAYTDSTGASVKVALCNDRACTSAVLKTIETGSQFRGVSVAVGPFDEPMVAYYRPPTDLSTQPTIRFARCVDPGCSAASPVTLDAWEVIGQETDLAVDADGKPIVVYSRPALLPRVDDDLMVVRCVDFACNLRTLGAHPDPQEASQPAVVIGSDGRPVFAARLGGEVRVAHCSNPDCTNATDVRLTGSSPSLALGGDGRVVVGFRSGLGSEFQRCADLTCTTLVPGGMIEPSHGSARLAIAPPDRPLAAYYGGPVSQLELKVERCLDSTCAGASTAIAIGGENSFNHALAADRPGNALVSFYDAFNRDLRVAFLGTPPEISIGDDAVFEGQAGQTVVLLPVSLSGAETATVDFATADGTATSPADYLPTSGTLTFTPGTSTLFVTVPVVGDVAVEPDETFRVLLSNAVGAPIVDAEGLVTILDDDATPRLSVSDVSTVEGDSGFSFVLFEATLDVASPTPVSVDFVTQGGTATEGTDYIASSGSVSFAPGQMTSVISVAVLGDLVPEPDETFFLRLQNPQGAVIDDGEGIGTIVNDDGPPEAPPLGELRHGASYAGDFAANASGADEDVFPLAQEPYASYEVVVDAVSADARPLALERRDSGGTVVQSGGPVGTGSAVALRWIVAGTTPVTDETVRIAGACGAACGPDDVYRVRAYETTLRAPRYNNSGVQTTVLLLQNRTDAPVSAVVRFWSAFGALVATYVTPAPIEPHGLLVLNTATVAPLTSGTITVAHDAPYGELSGKAVALDVPTGFSFDTPLEPRPR
jgi:Calx-beta domain